MRTVPFWISPSILRVGCDQLRAWSLSICSRRRIGSQNITRIRNMSMGGFDNAVGSTMQLWLLESLEKLYLDRKRGTGTYASTPRGCFSDATIRNILGKSLRETFSSCVDGLYKKNSNLRIHRYGYWKPPPWQGLHYPHLVASSPMRCANPVTATLTRRWPNTIREGTLCRCESRDFEGLLR